MGHQHHTAGKRSRHHDDAKHGHAEHGAKPGKSTRVHGSGTAKKQHKPAHSDGEAEKLPLQSPELFRVWGYAAEDPELGDNQKRALASFAKDMLANDRLIMITGHTSKGEDAGVGTKRAVEVQTQLRELGIPDARLVDAVGKGHKVPLGDGAGRDRRVEIYYVEATDLVSSTAGSDGGDVAGKAPEEGEANEYLEYLKLGAEGLHVIEVVTHSLAAGLGSLVAPLLEMVILADEEGVAAKNWIRGAYFDGAITAAGDAQFDILAGGTRVDVDDVYSRVLTAYHGSRTEVFSNVFAYQDQVLAALQSGVQISAEMFDPVMVTVENEVAAKLAKDRPGSWKSIYDKIIASLRSTAATNLKTAIVTAVVNERAGS